MKILFDQNLSRTLVSRLSDLFPQSIHVLSVGLNEADDAAIWEFAKLNGLTIVSKDDDFHQRSFLYGHPPKVIILALGNCSTNLVEQTMREHHSMIRSFETDEASVLMIP